MPIFFPAKWVLLDVLSEAQQCYLVPDDLVEEPRLPGEFWPSAGPDPLGTGAFEMPDGLAQNFRTFIEAWRLEMENPMEMVGHHDPGIEIYMQPAPGHLQPFLCDD